ncbi:MAG: site-2 protease family protein [Clostridia bacterium]|nr:site-2 protease family protein [Clostridia bacterium]
MIFDFITSGLPFIEILAIILAYAFALLIAFGLHEFSHAYVSYKLGDSTPKALGRLTLNPLKHIDSTGFVCLVLFGFGWAKPVPINPANYKHFKRDMIFVSLSGVTTNLILAFLFTGIYFFVSPLIAASTNLLLIFVFYFIYFMIIINFTLFVFNLIPVFPLDGFNFLQALLPMGNKFITFMQKYGTIILIVFLVTPLYDMLFSYITKGLLNIFISFWGLFI